MVHLPLLALYPPPPIRGELLRIKLYCPIPWKLHCVYVYGVLTKGRFLAVGDQDRYSLYILDKLAGSHPTISAATTTRPTALVWENQTALYIGLSDGCFIHYRIDLRGNQMVKGTVNNSFYGVFSATTIALDVESKTLAMSVGPEVFAFRRIRKQVSPACRRIRAVNLHGLR